MNFKIVNRKMRRKTMQTFIYLINKWLTIDLATKYRLK